MSTSLEPSSGAEQVRQPIVLPELPWTERYGRLLWGAIGIISCFAIWQFGVMVGILDPIFVSTPGGVLLALIKYVSSDAFAKDLASTAQALFVGLFIAFVVGVTAGLLIGWFRTLHALFEPVIAAVYAVPYVAFLPMIIMWTGIGNTSRTIIVIWSAIFPLIINSIQGVREVDSNYLRVARSFAGTDTQVFFTVILPGTLPYILAGLRLTVGRALVGVIIAEFFMASKGIGYFINLKSTSMQMGDALAAIALVAILGVSLVSLVGFVESRFRSWS